MTFSKRKTGRFTIPLTLWMTWFLFFPLVFILIYSLQTKGPYGGIVYVWNLDQYARALDPLYGSILLNSVGLAAMTSLSCLLIGYPMAWTIARSTPKMRPILMALVMMPFMSNFVIRAYAVKFLIGVEGPLSRLLLAFGVIQGPFLLNRSLSVWYGMLTNYLPFMVLPLVVAFDQFDMRLLEAGRDLGASSWKLFWRVLWPLTRPAIGTGFTLVFIPALGEFVIPDLLGGARVLYLGGLITEQFLKARDWPFGSALGVLMLLCVSIALILRRLLWQRVRIAGRERAV